MASDGRASWPSVAWRQHIGLTDHVQVCVSRTFAVSASLELQKAGLGRKLDTALHVVSGCFSAG